MPNVCSRMRATARQLLLALSLLLAANIPVAAALPGSDEPVLSRTQLTFGAMVSAGGQALSTPPQILFLEQNGSPGVPWSAEVKSDWLQVEPERGTTPSRLAVRVRVAAISGAARTETEDIVITLGSGPAATQRVVHVTLNVLGRNTPPFGLLDAPAGDITLTSEPVRLFGWALDDIAATDVEVCRERAPGEIPQPGCSHKIRALVGHAVFIDSARPDVAAAFPATPRNTLSSWSFAIEPTALPPGRPIRIFVIAHDIQGQEALLATRTVTVHPAAAQSPGSRTLTYLTILVVVIVSLLAFHVVIGVCRLRRRCDGASSAGDDAGPVSVVERLAVLVVVSLFLLSNASRLGSGLGYDELYTASRFVVGVPLWSAASSVGVFNNHIAYSLLAGLSVRLLGPAEWAIRLPALLLGALTIYMSWRLARMLFDRSTAVCAAVLLAVSPFFAEWSRSARGYTGLAAMTVVSTYCFLLLMRRRSQGAAVAHAVSTVLAVYFHLYGVWLPVVQYACYVVSALRRRWSNAAAAGMDDGGMRQLWVVFPVIGLVTSLLYAPVALQLFQVALARGRAPFVARFPWDVYRAITGTTAGPLAAAIGAVALLGLVHLWRQRLAFAYVILLLLVPMATMWLVARPADLYPRFFVFVAPFVMSLIAGGLSAAFAWSRRRRSVAAAVTALAPAAVAVVAVVLVGGWVRADLAYAPDPGYRALLRTPAGDRSARTFAAGGDSEMFAYYMGPGMTVLHSVDDLDARMREYPRIVVAYHEMRWNSPLDRDMVPLLRRRCHADDRGTVTMFRCD
jgi:hypothetical protein